jgi:hypothetical protein
VREKEEEIKGQGCVASRGERQDIREGGWESCRAEINVISLGRTRKRERREDQFNHCEDWIETESYELQVLFLLPILNTSPAINLQINPRDKLPFITREIAARIRHITWLARPS